MPRPLFRSIMPALLLAALVTVIASPVAAGVRPSQTGGAPGGIYNWYALAPGKSVEWDFQYPGGAKLALIAFGIDPTNSLTVNVYTDEQWRGLGAGNWQIEPVGRGTPGTLNNWSSSKELIDNGKLFWEATGDLPLLYHIQLSNWTQAAARYWIAQAGLGTGQLTPYSGADLAASETVQPASPVVEAPAQQPGAAAGPTSPKTVAAHRGPPPNTLPTSGSPVLLVLSSAGLALLAAGSLIRRTRS